MNLCSIESFTFWIIYIYIDISLSATAPGNTCLARASKMRTEYDSSKSIYFGLFCLPFKLSMSLFLFLWRIASISQARVSPPQEVPLDMINHIPIGSMYAIYGNIYHQYTPNVSIYTIHGSYGISIIYQSYINHLKSSDPAPRAIAAIAPFFPSPEAVVAMAVQGNVVRFHLVASDCCELWPKWPKGSAAVVLWRFCKQCQAIKR